MHQPTLRTCCEFVKGIINSHHQNTLEAGEREGSHATEVRTENVVQNGREGDVGAGIESSSMDPWMLWVNRKGRQAARERAIMLHIKRARWMRFSE